MRRCWSATAFFVRQAGLTCCVAAGRQLDWEAARALSAAAGKIAEDTGHSAADRADCSVQVAGLACSATEVCRSAWKVESLHEMAQKTLA